MPSGSLFGAVVTVIFKPSGRPFGAIVTVIFKLSGRLFGAAVTVILQPLDRFFRDTVVMIGRCWLIGMMRLMQNATHLICSSWTLFHKRSKIHNNASVKFDWRIRKFSIPAVSWRRETDRLVKGRKPITAGIKHGGVATSQRLPKKNFNQYPFHKSKAGLRLLPVFPTPLNPRYPSYSYLRSWSILTPQSRNRVWKHQEAKTCKYIIPNYTLTQLTICNRAVSYECL